MCSQRIPIILFIIFSIGTVQSQSFWTSKVLAPSDIVRSTKKFKQIEQIATLSLDFEALSVYLEDAPEEFSGKGLPLWIPLPDGTQEEFLIVRSPVMMPLLQKKYPQIQSYKGYQRGGSKNLRFDLGSSGFHAFIHSQEGQYFIDPVFDKKKSDYVVYYTDNEKVPSTAYDGTCLTQDTEKGKEEKTIPPLKNLSDPIQLRTYRLALACTGEWGASKGNTIAEALSVIVTSVNRLNQIFENELAIRLLLVDQK